MSLQDAIIVLPAFCACLGFCLAAAFPKHFGINLK
jgi:hypothetical protein